MTKQTKDPGALSSRNKAEGEKKRFLKLPEVLKLVPVSKSGWYEGIKNGIYPDSVRLGCRSVAWLDSDIHRLCELIYQGKSWKDAGGAKP